MGKLETGVHSGKEVNRLAMATAESQSGSGYRECRENVRPVGLARCCRPCCAHERSADKKRELPVGFHPPHPYPLPSDTNLG